MSCLLQMICQQRVQKLFCFLVMHTRAQEKMATEIGCALSFFLCLF